MRRSLWLTTASLIVAAIPAAGEAQQAASAPPPNTSEPVTIAPAPATNTAAPTVTIAVPTTSGQSSRTTTYTADYFTPFAPRTAYDIVQHVPGFSLDLGSTQTQNGSVDVRGFAGTAGNVVINGSRPSSKAETLDVLLQRLPAQQVVRVEVSPGDLFGSDYAGKSQVLNLVMSKQSGIEGNVTASATKRYTGYLQPNLSGSAVITRGPSTVNVSAGLGRNKQYEEGTDTLTNAATGTPIEFRKKDNVYENRDPFVAASYALEPRQNVAYHLNARWQPSKFNLFQNNLVIPAEGPEHQDNLYQDYKDPLLEIGGDVMQPLGGGAIKFVALTTRRKRDDVDLSLIRNGLIDLGAAVIGGTHQIVQAKRDETLGRLSWAKPNLLGFSFEVGGEGAFNILDDHVTLFEFTEDGREIPIDLPVSDATVKEWRGEVYVNVGRNLGPHLRIDGGLNYEFSHLTVSGDATEDRRLKFLKPSIAVDWKPGGKWDIQGAIRRTVAQLDFYDFISSADLSAQRVNGGNAALVPQRTWEFRATVQHPILHDGLVKLDLGHDQVSLLQDHILICDPEHPDIPELCFDAPGNIGTGTRDFAQLTVDLPLSKIWEGLRAKGDVTFQRTRVRDPIDLQMRKWSGFYPMWNWNVDIRRDKGKWSYGAAFNDYQRFTAYRTDEFDTNYNGGVFGSAFIEYRPAANWAVTFDVDNLLNTKGDRHRLRFFPNRLEYDLSINEFRERNRHRSFGLTLKRSFGGGGGGTAVAKAQ